MMLLSVFLSLLVTTKVSGVVEKSTGFDFPSNVPKLGRLRSLGVRRKGPIKVYAVGMYEDPIFKAKSFMLQMSMGVGAQKMTSALVDAVKPRIKSDEESLTKFSELMLKGLPNGCSRNMCLSFGTGGGKLTLTVDGQHIGAVPSKPLAEAFVRVYSDSNAVCKLYPVADDL